MKTLTKEEKQILAMCHYNGSITQNDCLKFYSSPQYTKNVLVRLRARGLLALKDYDYGIYIITFEGKSAIGIEENEKLTKYVGGG